MMVGIYLCYIDRERGLTVEFGTLFRGFDQFKDALIATLIMIGLSFVLLIPIMIAMFVVILVPIIAAQGNAGPPPEPSIWVMLMFYPVIILVSFAVYIPFLFAFQLIADRKLTGLEAVKLSARGTFKNLGGVILYMFMIMFISIVLAMMCYVPAFFFMPISFGSMFVLYRDIYSADIVTATEVTPSTDGQNPAGTNI